MNFMKTLLIFPLLLNVKMVAANDYDAINEGDHHSGDRLSETQLSADSNPLPFTAHARGGEMGPRPAPFVPAQPGSGPRPGWGPAPGYGPRPGWGPAPGYGPRPGWGPAPGYGPRPGWGPAPGYGPLPGWGSYPRPVRWGYSPWQHWTHPYFARPAFYFDWYRLTSVTCAALDSRGNAYPVMVNELPGWAYQEKIEQIEDLALDRCYQESGGDPNCLLQGCWPGY